VRCRTLDGPGASLNVPDLGFRRALMFQHTGIFPQHGSDIRMLPAESALVDADGFAVERFRVVPCVLLRSHCSQNADSISERSSVFEETAFRLDCGGENFFRFGDVVFT